MNPAQTPQRDPGLQPERTALAWRRCGLLMLSCALALAAVDRRAVHLAWLLPGLAVALLAAVLVAFNGPLYHRMHASPVSALSDGRAPALVAVSCTALGLVALATWYGAG